MKYHIARNGQQAGTFSEEEVRARLQRNEFSPADLCWTEGMADWQQLGQRFEPSALAAGQPLNPYAPPQAGIISSRQAAGGLELATPVDRLVARILDGVITIPFAVPLMIGVGMMAPRSDDAPLNPSPLSLALIGVSSLLLVGLLVYNLVLLAKRGQTLGKKWMSVRIVTHPDGANPGGVKTILLRGFVNGLIGMVPFLGFFYSITDICFIFREDRRCIHDLIAGTQVVKGQPPGM